MNQKMTFMQACRDFFGVRPGTTAIDFGKEIKALTPEDRKEISAGLEKNGYELIAAPGVAV